MRPMRPDPIDLDDVARLTCVLATTTRSGTSIARPVSVLRDAERGTFTVTGWAAPVQRVDVRRDPRVALLFSGGDVEVLVQGGAGFPDDVAAALADLDRHEGRRTRPPAGRDTGADPLSRRLVDLYRGRALLVVEPTLVHGRPAVDARTTPRPTTAAPPSAHRAPRGAADEGSPAFRAAARRLTAVDSAILAASDGAGAPWLLRVRPVPHPATGTFLVEVPPSEHVRPGPASLLAQDADDRRPWPGPGVVLGQLAQTGGTWVFTPHGRVPGVDADPRRVLAEARDVGRAARRRLVPRPLLPPPLPGGELAFAGTRRPPGAVTRAHTSL